MELAGGSPNRVYHVLLLWSASMRWVLVYLSALGAWTVWSDVIVPLIAKLFGVPYRFAFWRVDRHNQHLRRRQYFWFVWVLGFGGGLSVFLTLSDLLRWKVLGERATDPISLSFQLGISLLAGATLGLTNAPKENKETANTQ